MRFSLDKAMGIHAEALFVRARRSSLIASNIANADTPNYKAQDIDFKSILRNSAGMPDEGRMKSTHRGHIQAGGFSASSAELLYRYPHQPSIDGNTVDAQVEKAEFAENTLMYQTSLKFIDGKISGIKKAIRGD